MTELIQHLGNGHDGVLVAVTDLAVDLEPRLGSWADYCVVVAASDMSSGLAFQRAPGNLPPTWPDPAVPQQVHLDIMVEDVAAAGARVLTLGAVKLDGENVYADPAGHPFCLIRRPRWAPPIPDDA